MKTIAAMLALTIALPAAAAPTQQALMVGRWRSVDDVRSRVEIRADGSWIDSYAGMPSATSRSSWRLFSGAHPPKEATGQALDAKSTYLEVTDKDAGPLFYELELVNAKSLELSYLARGNELTYVRAGAAAAR